MIKIGYQGMEGSNSEAASLKFIEEKKLKDVKLVPLISSKNVVNALTNKEIDYGIVAVENSKAGIVIETRDAINDKIEHIYECTLDIHHCLFKKKNISLNKLTKVASHPQALKQTKATRKELYSNLEEIEVEDTAIAAKYLSKNILDETTAIICKKEAGLVYNLELIQENIEDEKDNRTKFYAYKLK